ncbi:ATP-binding protein [Granulicella cerasi]|uniref:histidine kinase n=1 Tax=Granulicella cerasi TaxID=741063 RepID=A0ABW1Z9W9_9BACT|nr:ATP-binding protein [Granulicella cerasi]
MFAQLLDALPEGLILCDADFRILYANTRAQEVSRLVDEDFNSRTHWELFPQSVGTIVETVYRRVQRTRVAENLPDVYYAPFDTWFRVHALPVGDADLALFYADVTEEHRLAAERSDVEGRLALALHAYNGIGMWDWDIVNDRVYSDSHFARIYRVDPAVASSGTPIAEFTRYIHPEDKPDMTARILRCIETDKPFDAEYRVQQADGTSVWIAARGQVQRNATGDPIRFPGIAIDITERKKTEAALIQAEKLAAVGRLASSIAHEINNPLEAVTNLVYLARQGQDAQDIHTFLDLAEQELKRVSVIVNQTLRFHKQSTRPTPCHAKDLFDSTLGLYEGRLRNCNIKVDLRSNAGTSIECFEGDIRQVLSNLVGNAIDAMPQGGRLILAAREATDILSGRRGIRFTIADTGVGISRATSARIFDAFFTTKGHSGTGLGLWISADIIQRHGGTLRLRSSQSPEHHGTVFTLFLPFGLGDGVIADTTLAQSER